MVNITLGNYNQDSPFKQAIIDIATGMCVVDGQEIETKLLAKTMDFSHPLLTQPILESSGCSYVYEYDDFDGLVDAAKFIYATLIQANNPLDCEFRIAPSVNFVRLKNQYKIPLSIDYKKQARELIGIEQFNLMISRFNGFNFQYLDNIVLEQKITPKNLPLDVDGDLLYQTDLKIAQFCKQADDMRKFEIRYINRFIGFGVFAREDIEKGEFLAQYCGLKTVNRVGNFYVFGQKKDALNSRIDAKHYGNIARFINHAPKNLNPIHDKRCRKALVSNIIGKEHNLYGSEVVIYTAHQNISKGEQLLMDYGESYFRTDADMFFIKHNGNIVDSDNKKINESSRQRQHSLQLMAQHGVKQAQWLLVRKPLIVLMVTVLFAALNWARLW